MEMTRLWRSRALREVGYDAATRTLRIDFLNGGRYEYLDVGPEVYEGMIHSAHRGPNGAKRCWGTSTAGSTERAGAPVRIGRGHRDRGQAEITAEESQALHGVGMPATVTLIRSRWNSSSAPSSVSGTVL